MTDRECTGDPTFTGHHTSLKEAMDACSRNNDCGCIHNQNCCIYDDFYCKDEQLYFLQLRGSTKPKDLDYPSCHWVKPI